MRLHVIPNDRDLHKIQKTLKESFINYEIFAWKSTALCLNDDVFKGSCSNIYFLLGQAICWDMTLRSFKDISC